MYGMELAVRGKGRCWEQCQPSHCLELPWRSLAGVMDGVMDGISTRLARVGCAPRCLFCFGKAARQLRSPAGAIPTPLRLP